jgi:hypothetical protein
MGAVTLIQETDDTARLSAQLAGRWWTKEVK